MSEKEEVREPTPRRYYLSATLTAVAVAASNSFVPLYLKSLGLSYVGAGVPLVIRAMGRFSFDATSIYIMGLIRPGVVLCSGIAVTALGVLTCGLFPSAFAVNGAYLFIGVGMAAFHVTLRQIVFEMSRKGGRGRAIGILSVFIAIGPAAGILLGGVISDHAGYRILFFSCAALIWIPFFLLYPLRDQRTDRRKNSKGNEPLHWGIVRDIFSIPGTPLLCACSLFIFFYQQAISLALAFYATDSIGLSLSAYGLLRSLSQGGNMSGRYLGGHGSDRFGPAVCLVTGFLISSVGFFLFPWSRGFWPLLVVCTVIYLGLGLINVSSQVGIMSMVRSRMRGQAIGLYRAVGDVGMFLGPLAITASLEKMGFLWSFMWLGTLPLIFALWIFLMFPRR